MTFPARTRQQIAIDLVRTEREIDLCRDDEQANVLRRRVETLRREYKRAMEGFSGDAT